MLNFFLALLLLPASVDSFKKEKTPLESGVDSVIASTGAQVMQRSRASYIEGYGIVLTLEIVFEPPQGIFGTPKTAQQLQTLIGQRRKKLQEDMAAFVKQRVATSESLGPAEALTIVVHILNVHTADVPNLPGQIQFTVKKSSPQEAIVREF
jgi:hypothetical protein